MLGPSSRPSLPTSSSEFALPSTSSASSSSSPSNPASSYAADDLSPFMLRFRRPSLLVPRAPLSFGDRSSRSPLATSVLTRRSNSGESSESDRDNIKMMTDSPPSGDSGAATPLLPGPATAESDPERDQDSAIKTSRPRSPSAPPMQPSASSSSGSESLPDSLSFARAHSRRPSHNLKAPRIRSLISESRPDENEVRSEAQFQRLIASCCELPTHPRTPRAASDRGRYPEEADVEEPHREDTPSDDGEFDDVPFSYVEPINILKPVTPAHSVSGDDFGMLESPGGMAMDIDLPSSVLGSPIMSGWRHTPPPTSSAVRTNKRKLDDRYDPYPSASKRRAVSPSLSYLRESQPSLFSPRTPAGAPRLSMPIPIPMPMATSSATSSPVVGPSSSYFSRGPHSALSSPTLRAQIGLSSPVLRPILPRPRRHNDLEREEREVDGAGDGVGELSLA